MTRPTVLISGAGIAGPSLAYWLTGNGYRVIIVELAPGIRTGGQTVDLRGAGRDVVRLMGLLDQMTDRSLEQRGLAWIKADGSRRAEMPPVSPTSHSMTMRSSSSSNRWVGTTHGSPLPTPWASTAGT